MDIEGNHAAKANNNFKSMGSQSDSSGRGLLDADGEVLSPCNAQYLHILLLELLRARAFPLVKIGRIVDINAQQNRIEFIEHEFTRLLNQPQLFPSPDVKGRFLTICFSLDAEMQHMKACKDLLVENEMRQVQQISRDKLSRPSYLKDSYGWENFLLANAPGTGATHKKTVPESSFQMFPAIAMRIVGDYEREESDIVRYIRNTGNTFGAPASSTTLLVDFDHVKHSQTTKSERWPEYRLRMHSDSFVVSPSPFREDLSIQLDLDIGASRLEGLSPLIHRLEQDAPAAHAPVAALNAPNAFPTMALRSWHPPMRLYDLRMQSD